MPVNITPLGENKAPEPEVPKIYSDSYKHSIVDSSYQPEVSLLTMVSGSPRLGEYYRQYLTGDEEPTPFSPGNTGTYQSYTRIKNCIIRQEGGGAYNFDPTTAQSTTECNGWVVMDVAPVRYDVIIFDIGDGNAGLFMITEQPEIRNFTANKVYYITYKLMGILTEENYLALNSCVVKELVYSKDSALSGGAGLLTTDEFEASKELFSWRGTIGNYLMRTFYWNPEKTIAFKNSQGQYVYDPYLVNFLCAIMPPDLRTTYPFINQFSVQYGGLERGYHGTINIWEVLLRGDFNLLRICDDKAALMQTTRLANTRMYGNLRSSKFRYFVTTNPEDFIQYKAYFNADGFPILQPSVSEPIANYLFTEEFYKGQPANEFEHLVWSVLKDKILDRQRLLRYCKTYFDLPQRQQLYYGAILILLLEASRKLRTTI
jgi:hypothetical protein